MNKVNLCWVISEGRKGHEIQSLTVAKALANEVTLFRFQSTSLQKIVAPRVFAHNIQKTNWITQQPKTDESPDLIISCGRQAAAAAKALKLKTGSNHIHILNPKGKLSDYDLLLLPKHDEVNGDNVCQFTGSIHDVNRLMKNIQKNLYQGCVAVMLGNPNTKYWSEQWPIDWQIIKQMNKDIFICGSPRLADSVKLMLKSINKNDNLNIWLCNEDGNNPYQTLLCNADHFFVTADSINMMNECMATGKKTELLGKQFITSRRHQNFIQSIEKRKLDSSKNWPNPIEEIINNSKLQNLLKSPPSFNKG